MPGAVRREPLSQPADVTFSRSHRAGIDAAANGGSAGPTSATGGSVGAIDAEGRPADELSFSYNGSEVEDEDDDAESRQLQPTKVSSPSFVAT